MASVVAGTPAWARLDPLPIATRADDEDDDTEDGMDESEQPFALPQQVDGPRVSPK